MKLYPQHIILLLLFFTATNIIKAQDCTLNAGTDVTTCTATGITLSGSAGYPAGSPWVVAPQWSVVSQPAGSAIAIPNSGSLNTIATNVTLPGTYILKLQATCAVGGIVTDQITFTVSQTPNAPTVTDVSAGCISIGQAINIVGSTPPAGVSASWSASPGTTGSISAPASPSTTFTPDFAQYCAASYNYNLTYSYAKAGCVAGVSMVITASQKTTVTAAAYPVEICGVTTVLSGSCMADGVALWSVVAQPAGSPAVSFSNTSNQKIAAFDLVTGTYTFRYQVTGGCAAGQADVTVHVISNGTVTPAVAGASQYLCSMPGTISLNGSAPATGETAQWKQIGGGTTVTFATPNSTNSIASGLTDAGAPYKFLYTIQGQCFSVDSIAYRKIPPTAAHFNNGNITCFNFTGYAGPYTNIQANTSYFGPFQKDDIDTLTVTVAFIDGPGTVNYTANPVYSSNYTNAMQVGSTTHTLSPGSIITDKLYGASLYNASSPAIVNYMMQSYFAVATPGDYNFRITYATKCSTQSSLVKLSRAFADASPNAGTDPSITCIASSVTLSGNYADGFGRWFLSSGPAGATNPINGSNTLLQNPPLSGLIPGIYTFGYQANQGFGFNLGCSNTIDYVSVLVSGTAPTGANAGTDLTGICQGAFQLQGSAVPSNAIATWSQLSPASPLAIFNNKNIASPVITGLAANTTYTFRYTFANNCGSSFDDVVITTNNTLSPKPIDFQNDCVFIHSPFSGEQFIVQNYNANALDTRTFTEINPGNLTVPAPTVTTGIITYNNLATPAGAAVKNYFAVALAVSRAGCSNLIFRDTARFWYGPNTASYFGSPVKDTFICSVSGYPINIPLIAPYDLSMPMKWSVEFITGSSNPTIANTTASSTTVTIPGDGTYRFKYEIDAQTITTECMTTVFNAFAPQFVNVYTSQAGSIALAGPDLRLCNGSGAGNLAATALTVGTGKWEVYKVLSGVAPVLADVASPSTGIQFTQSGESILRWISYGTSATCGESSSDQVTVSWIPPANAGADQAPCNASATTLNGAVVAPGTGAWSQLSGPTAVSFTNINDPKTPVSNLANGNYVFHFAATDGLGCTSGDDVNIVINNVTTVPDAGSNGVICSGGSNKIRLAAIPATTGLTGTWTIANKPAGAPLGNFSNSANQADAIYDGVTTPGNYTFKWTLSNGSCIASDFVQYTANSTGCTLPVTLISFIAVKKGTATLLDWLVADEVNFSHYDVERSANGINFKKLGSLPSGSISKKYKYTDPAPERGINYYRLKMVDTDGFVKYSTIQSLNYTDGSFKIYLQPNPTHANITITGVKTGYTIRIISMDGKLITEKLCTGNIMQLDIMALSAGLYTAQILDGNATVRNIKFLKE